MMVELSTGAMSQLVLFSTAVAFLGCLVAACTDFKWGIVPDKLNYALISICVVLVFLRFELVNALLI